MELVGGIDQAMEEIVAGRALVHFLLEKFLQSTGLRSRRRGGENDALALADRHLKITGGVQILVRGVTALLLLRILYATVPVGLEHKFVFLGELHEQVGITGIHACLDTIVDLAIGATCHCVLVRKLAHTAESEEGTETKRGGRVSVVEGIANQDAVFKMLEDNFLS